ncbi:hypothetical protein JCM16106_15330 [Hydrogenophilus islandicus]
MTLRPLTWALGLVAALLIATITVVTVAPPPHPNLEAPPPWVATASPEGWQIMGWTLGATNPQAVAARLGSDVQWAIIRRPDHPPVLEGWVPDFAVQGVTGKLLLQFSLSEPLLSWALADATGAEVTANGHLRRPFDPIGQKDERWRQLPTLQLITLLPAVRLDAATLELRFAPLGAPRRWQDRDQSQHWLFTLSCAAPCVPLGIHLVLPAERGSPVIEYAAADRFAHLTLSPP